MNKYLNIEKECEILYGNNGAVIYDFKNAKPYNILYKESEILCELQKGCSLNQVYSKYNKEIIDKFISTLQDSGVGYISNHFIPKEHHRIGNLNISKMQKIYSLYCAYIELPIQCSQTCSYCNKPKINGCYACSTAKEIKNKDIYFYQDIIDTLLSYNCKNIVLHGGNPLEDWSFTKTILDYIIENNIINCNIFLITNDSIINNTIDISLFNYISNNNITLIINTDYLEEYNTKNYLDKYTIFKQFDINFILNFNVNYSYIESFKIYYTDLLNKFSNITYSIYAERSLLKIDYLTDLPNNPIDINWFNNLDSIHPCLFGKISIKSDKKVYPCIGFNNNEIISLSEYKLEDLFFDNEKLFKYWNISVNTLNKCCDCKFRKSCSDCRAFEAYKSNNILSKLTCNLV